LAYARRPAAGGLKPQDLERSLAASASAPVYLLAGGESVLRDRALRALKGRVVAAGLESFNYRSLEPSGLDAISLSEEMRVLPMGGGGRLVVIGPAESLGKDQLKALSAYAADPSSFTCLVLVAGEVKETLRKAFEGAVEVDCSSPWEDRIPALLSDEAAALGVKLDREAAAVLAALCGRDLSRAVGELRKAASRVGPGGVVAASLIRDLAGGGEAADIYKVAFSLVRGDAPGAVGAVRRFLESEERAEPRVLYELGMHLRRLLAARGHAAAGMPVRDAAKAAGVFWKDVDAFAADLPRWTEARIAAAFRRLLAADRSVKRGLDDGPAAIEAYIWATFAAPTGASREGAAGRSR
jgi:DNA polymerase III subunit delta